MSLDSADHDPPKQSERSWPSIQREDVREESAFVEATGELATRGSVNGISLTYYMSQK